MLPAIGRSLPVCTRIHVPYPDEDLILDGLCRATSLLGSLIRIPESVVPDMCSEYRPGRIEEMDACVSHDTLGLFDPSTMRLSCEARSRRVIVHGDGA